MMAIAILCVYAIGYFCWFGYALNRFSEPVDFVDRVTAQLFVSFLWPIVILCYIPYRFCTWLGVRP